jgi:hypothetical protein
MWEWLGNLLAGPVVTGLLNAYKAKLAATNATDEAALSLAVAQINAEIARKAAQKDLGIASMSHPVWWMAWGLFVIPVGLYHATIFLLSTFGVDPHTFAVLKVPAEEQALSQSVIEYLFLAQSTSGVIGAVVKRFTK